MKLTEDDIELVHYVVLGKLKCQILIARRKQINNTVASIIFTQIYGPVSNKIANIIMNQYGPIIYETY